MDLSGYIDPRELQRLMAMQLRGEAPQAGMMLNQSAVAALSPEQRAELEAQMAASTRGLEARLSAEQNYINEMRRRGMPEGRQAGNVYTAANPLEFLGALATRYVGEKRQGEMDTKYDELDEAERRKTEAGLKLARADALEKMGHETGLQTSRLESQERVATERNQAADARADADRKSRESVANISAKARKYAADASSSGDDGRIYDTDNYVDEDGNTLRLGRTANGRIKNLDSGEFLAPNEMAERGIRQQNPLTPNQMNKTITKYEEDVAGFRRIQENMAAAEEVWTDYGWEKGEESPLGFFTKQQNAIGGLSRAIGDQFFEGSPFGDSFAAARTVMNEIARQRAGLSQTGIELENIKAESGLDALSDPEVFINYWDRLGEALSKDRKALDETLSPVVRKEIDKRAKLSDERAAAVKPAGMSDEEWEELQELEARFGNPG